MYNKKTHNQCLRDVADYPCRLCNSNRRGLSVRFYARGLGGGANGIGTNPATQNIVNRKDYYAGKIRGFGLHPLYTAAFRASGGT